MSKVVPLTVLASAGYQQQAAAQKRVAALRTVKASTDTVAANIASGEKVANKVYTAFNSNTATLSAEKLASLVPAIAKLHASLGKNYRASSVNLAKAIAMGAPTQKILGQMESLATLRNKVASLIVQAKATLAADDTDFDKEELIPVDEQGYVVDTPDATDAPLNEPGVQAAEGDVPVDTVVPTTTPEENADPIVAGAEPTVVDPNAPIDAIDPATAADPVVTDPASPIDAIAADDDEPDVADDGFVVPDLQDLDLPTDGIDELTAAEILDGAELPVDLEEPAPATAAAKAALRTRTATRTPANGASSHTAAVDSEAACLASMMADLTVL